MNIKHEQSMEQTILEVAEKLFLEKGFAMTSTTEIAKAVGCNQALVHYYFRTKENLFNTIFEQKFNALFQGIFEITNLEQLQFQDKLKCIIESHFDLLRANPKMPALIFNELSRQPGQIAVLRDKLYSSNKKLFTIINEELNNEIKNGRMRNISIIDLVLSMLSLNITLFLMIPVITGVLQLDEEQKELLIQHRRAENVDFVLNSLRP